MVFHTMVKSRKTTTHIKKTWDSQSGGYFNRKKVEMIGLKLPHLSQSREETTFFHLFEEPDGTGYDLILGRNFQQSIGVDILNSYLYFIVNKVQVPMVYRGY